KPSLSKLDPEQHRAELRAFALKLEQDLLPAMAQRGSRKTAREKGAARPAAAAESSGAGASRDLRALQGYLAELAGSPDASRISALVMRVAREVVERALMFLIHDEAVGGLGGFGPVG